MDVNELRRVIRDLIALNQASIRLARELMIAQDVADELERGAELALDALADGRHEAAEAARDRALDAAVEAFKSADHAHATETSAATAYGAHVERVQSVTLEASRLLGELGSPTGSRDDVNTVNRRAARTRHFYESASQVLRTAPTNWR